MQRQRRSLHPVILTSTSSRCLAQAAAPRFTTGSHALEQALEHKYSGASSEVVFVIADCSAERKFLGPCRYVFAANGNPQLLKHPDFIFMTSHSEAKKDVPESEGF